MLQESKTKDFSLVNIQPNSSIRKGLGLVTILMRKLTVASLVKNSDTLFLRYILILTYIFDLDRPPDEYNPREDQGAFLA